MTKKQKKRLIQIIVSTILLIVVHLLPVTGYLQLILFLIPFGIIAYDVLWSAIKNIFHGQFFDEEFLMALACCGAFGVGEYLEAVAVMLLYQIGELFQSIALGKSRRSIASLMDIRPDTARIIVDGIEKKVSPDEVNLNDTILINPGEKIPLDGEILTGVTTVDASSLTGESLPVDKYVGDKVISGSINLSGVITVKVSSVFSESTVSKILTLVEEASTKKAKTENFINRFSRIYTPVVVVLAILLTVIPSLVIGGKDLFSGNFNLFWPVFIDWLKRSLIFLVVSCPCALVISVPLSFFGGIGAASKKGILVKGSNYLELLSNTKNIVFDKTGTLTKGTFEVSAIHSDVISKAKLLDITALAESNSTHPVANSIIKAHKGHIDRTRVTSIKEIAGKGIVAEIDNTSYYVGNSSLMDEINIPWHDCHVPGTIVHISTDSEYLGHIVINDTLKDDAKETIIALRASGIEKTIMLTGDNEKVATKISEELGIDEFHAGLLPKDKVDIVSSMINETKKTAFVGDGINDAPVLMRADIGIAMGALGSDAAIEAADIVLMDDAPSKIVDAIKISKKTIRIVKENIIFALVVKVIILILSALGFTNMWIAVFGDVGVLIIAILNALRTMKVSKK